MNFEYENFEFWIDDLAMKGMLFVAVSGAHAYGWARDDSDLDIRQVWCPDLAQAVSVFFRAKTKSWNRNNIDFMSYPIREYLRLLAKGNGNIVENLFQPKLWEQQQLVNSLQAIILTSFHEGHLNHYLGYSTSLEKDMNNPSRLKRYGLDKLILCRYRILLAGLLLDARREVIFSLQEQHKYIDTEHCMDILEHYQLHKPQPKSLLDKAQRELDSLHDGLQHALEETTLPSTKRGIPTIQLDRWITAYYRGSKL